MTTDEARRERELRIEREAVELRTIGTDIVARLDDIEPKLRTTTVTARKARRTARALVVAVLALVLVAVAAGVAVVRVVHLQSCVTSWADASQDRTSSILGPGLARSDAMAAVVLKLGEVTSILTSDADAKLPAAQARLQYVKALHELDAAEQKFRLADAAYTQALIDHPINVVAAKLRC